MQFVRQGGVLEVDYIKEFEMLSMRCELNESQEQTIIQFIGGLNKEIIYVVELQSYVSLEYVIKLAIKVERQHGCNRLVTSRTISSKLVSASSSNQRLTTRSYEACKEFGHFRKPHVESSWKKYVEQSYGYG